MLVKVAQVTGAGGGGGREDKTNLNLQKHKMQGTA